jgi:triosephosphate isomerase
MPQPIVAGNWKMHTSLKEAERLALDLRREIDGVAEVEKVLCPPFPYLALVRQCVKGSSLKVGAQNVHHAEKGAFTGEVSPAMLAELCQYVILGHSERRLHFGEADDAVSLKLKAAFRFGLRPILCVGETLEQRQRGEAEAVVRRQLEGALAGIAAPGNLVVAYEPVWAIGTGVPATPEAARQVMEGAVLRTLAALFGEHAALEIPLLYGGSVTAENVEGFVKEPCIHGALVGGASLRAADFAAIVHTTARVKGG